MLCTSLQMPQNAASAASQEQLLPPENDSQYFNALNAEPRVSLDTKTPLV